MDVVCSDKARLIHYVIDDIHDHVQRRLAEAYYEMRLIGTRALAEGWSIEDLNREIDSYVNDLDIKGQDVPL